MHRISVFLLFLLAPLLQGCWGYHTLGDTPGRIRSAAVVPFRNRTLYIGLEFELQDALVKELQAKSGIAVVGDSVADALLDGKVMDYRRAVIKQDPTTGQDIEFQITISADFTLRERRTGKVLADHQGVNISGTFLISRGETEATARARAMSKLAERIVRVILYRW